MRTGPQRAGWPSRREAGDALRVAENFDYGPNLGTEIGFPQLQIEMAALSQADGTQVLDQPSQALHLGQQPAELAFVRGEHPFRQPLQPPPQHSDRRAQLMGDGGVPERLLLGHALQLVRQRVEIVGQRGGAQRAPRLELRAAGFAPLASLPLASLPLFPSGRLCVELRLAELRKSSAVAEYERAIQTAFREVADGLAGRETFGRQIAAQGRTVASAERRADLSAQRYRAGVDGRLELLDAQGQLYAAKQALLDLRRGEFGNAVALYKALGGGLIDH